MLSNFVELERGEWVLQNAANSAVGQAVIQIAKARGLRTLNFIRHREHDEAERITRELKSLGADAVWMYSDLTDKAKLTDIKKSIGNNPIRLALNCVGGETTKLMLKLLGSNAHLVSYGAMSKEPLSIPTSYFIFKNLTAHGFWQSKWYQNHSRTVREKLLQDIADIITSGHLKEPKHEIIAITSGETDEQATQKVRTVLAEAEKGSLGRKILLRIDDPAS